MKPSFAVVGCGKVGLALAAHLTAAGYPMTGAASKSLESARKAAAAAQIHFFSDVPWKATPGADVVFITTPDGTIAETCQKIAARHGFKDNAVVLHCSGALPSTILAPAKELGLAIGSMHPLQSFATASAKENPFEGIVISTEGDKKALTLAQRMAEDLGARCYKIKTEAKTLYHAAAVVASNYLVTLESIAIQLLKAAGIPEKEAFTVLRPLILGTLSNIESVGITKALTGPIARGDAQTVQKHMAAIQELSPLLLEFYKILGRHTVPIAQKAGISKAAAGALLRLLEEE